MQVGAWCEGRWRAEIRISLHTPEVILTYLVSALDGSRADENAVSRDSISRREQRNDFSSVLPTTVIEREHSAVSPTSHDYKSGKAELEKTQEAAASSGNATLWSRLSDALL